MCGRWCLVLHVVLLCTTHFATVESQRNSPCITANNEEATCRSIVDCPLFLTAIRRQDPDELDFIRQAKCDQDDATLVCCGLTLSSIQTRMGEDVTNEQFTPNPAIPDRNNCGTQKYDSSRRLQGFIIGGNETAITEFPWMARLGYITRKGRIAWICGGTLINPQYVMSAAHCVTGDVLKFVGTLTYIKLGEHNTETEIDCDENGRCNDKPVTVSVQDVIWHKDYDSESASSPNDIALIRMERKVTYSDFVQPICLHSDQGIPDRYVISGWGETEKALFSTVKHKLELPPVDKLTCSEKYDSFGIELIESQICAGGENQKYACIGDSGGPLMYDNGTNWVAAGVASFGIGCGDEGWLGVYTNVSSFMPWISEQMMNSSLIASRNSHNKNKKHRQEKIIK